MIKEFEYRPTSGRFSYVPTLTNILKESNSEFVLEWGPGYSTYLFLTYLTDLKKLISIESHYYYYDLCKNQFIDDRFKLYLKRSISHQERYNWIGPRNKEEGLINLPKCNKLAYSEFPLDLNIQFDIIFIDGSDRGRCINTALKVIKSDGLIVLHDSNRQEYWKHVDLSKLEVITEKDNTTVFKNL